ncbi:MAG TPA: EF-hand domain-containing protein, partial [Verrucomicrobiaceae bacterium]
MKRLVPILGALPLLGGAFLFLASAAPIDDRLQELLRQFPDADLNHDGKLTVDEFRQFRNRTSPKNSVPSTSPATASSIEHPAAAANPPAAGKLQIRIRSSGAVPINPKIYGINCSEMFIFDLVQKPEYLAALGELQLNTFLFPGGSTYHHPTGSGGFNIRQDE